MDLTSKNGDSSIEIRNEATQIRIYTILDFRLAKLGIQQQKRGFNIFQQYTLGFVRARWGFEQQKCGVQKANFRLMRYTRRMAGYSNQKKSGKNWLCTSMGVNERKFGSKHAARIFLCLECEATHFGEQLGLDPQPHLCSAVNFDSSMKIPTLKSPIHVAGSLPKFPGEKATNVAGFPESSQP